MNIIDYDKIFWLRFEPPNPSYIIPRWHADGPYLYLSNRYTTNQKKILISLKGDGTLIAKCMYNQKTIQYLRNNEKERPSCSFDKKTNKIVENKANSIKNRKLNDNYIKNHYKIYQLKSFMGVEYNAGGDDNACVHSEPDKTSPRILLGVLISEKTTSTTKKR